MRRVPAKDLKTQGRNRYSMSVTTESMVALEKIALNLEKTLGVRLTRAQVLDLLITTYQANQLTKSDRGTNV